MRTGPGTTVPTVARPAGTTHGGREHAAGIDIGGTKLEGVVVDGRGTVVATHRLPTVPGPDGVLAGTVALLGTLAERAGVSLGGLGSVGVGTAGVVDERAGRIVHAVNLGIDGDGLALAAGVERLAGVPTSVENDVNAAAVGAHAALGSPSGDLALLSVGTGLAAGLVLGGRLRRGSRGAAGELGHLPVDPAGPPCSCGQRGCLETLASGRALARRWVEVGREPVERPAAAVFAAAAAGDPVARALRDDLACHLATAVRLLQLTVDVDVVVLGGGVAGVGEPLLDAVRSALTAEAGRSPLLARLALAERLRLPPPGTPLAAAGAALLGRTTTLGRRPHTPGTVPGAGGPA